MSSPGADAVFRILADFTYDWETWVGPEGGTRWVNPAVERITGYSVEACLEMPDYPMPLVHPDDRGRIREALRAAAEGSAGNDLEFRVLHRDGRVRWAAMSWQSLTVERGERLGYRTSVRDITARKQLETQLRDALERARAADRARASFLANVSHELRTPLHNLLGHVQLLEKASESPAGMHLQVIREQAAVLLQLVDDLLEVAAQDVRRVPRPRRRFDAAAALRRIVEAHRPGMEAQGLSLRLHGVETLPAEVYGDGEALGHILRNLLDNARKYTERGGVDVEAGWLVTSDGATLIVNVRDTGIGMEPERIATLRQPLVRGDDSSRRKAPGAGLGLAIVDRLCGQLGGSLSVHSAPGEGTRIEIRLPADPPPEAGATHESTGDLSGLRVLVVDDDAVSRELAAQLLLAEGCETDVAENGREAVASALRTPYDVVLMDLHMPELDGEQAAALLRAQAPPDAAMPMIVGLTADVFGAFDAPLRGFDACLTKPVHVGHLRQVLASLSSAAAEEATASIERWLDPDRLRELSTTRTADGETFLQRFAPRVVDELRRLATELDEAPGKPASEVLQAAHRIKGAASLIGASDLAREAEHVQSTAEQGEVAWAAVTSVAVSARRVAAALEQHFAASRRPR